MYIIEDEVRKILINILLLEVRIKGMDYLEYLIRLCKYNLDMYVYNIF